MHSESLLELLHAWELLGRDASVGHHSLKDWKRIASEVERRCTTFGEPALGSIHLGLNHGIQVSEGREPLSGLAPYVLMHDVVWLPNPIFSGLAGAAHEGWSWCPEAANEFFAKRGVRARWRNFWGVPTDARKHFLRTEFTKTLQVVRELEPLLESGVVRLLPWETLLATSERRACIKQFVEQLANDKTLIATSQSIPQKEFALGPRSGPIGMVVSDNQPPGSPLKPGEQMFLADKRPIVFNATLNALVSELSAASIALPLRGDRLIHDYLASGAKLPTEAKLADRISLPKFSAALWPDIMAIRRSSEALAILRSVLRDAATTSEEKALPELRERLEDAAARIRADASLLRAVKGNTIDVGVSVLMSAGFAAATAATAPGLAALSAALGAFAGLSPVVRSALDEERKARLRMGDLILRVAGRIDSETEGPH